MAKKIVSGISQSAWDALLIALFLWAVSKHQSWYSEMKADNLLLPAKLSIYACKVLYIDKIGLPYGLIEDLLVRQTWLLCIDKIGLPYSLIEDLQAILVTLSSINNIR